MMFTLLMLLSVVPGETLTPGDHYRYFDQGEYRRRYLVHVPEQVDAKSPAPVVLVLHGAAMNAARTVAFTQMNTKADEAGFIAVYPEGTGLNPLLTWNAGGLSPSMAAGKPDDVEYIERVLDDLDTAVSVDGQRVYATGMSNGGMMCYLLAHRLAHRIAAIAPVAGTMTFDDPRPTRPVPVLHIHGDADTIVPFAGPQGDGQAPIRFKSVPATIEAWIAANQCPPEPRTMAEPPTAEPPTAEPPTAEPPTAERANSPPKTTDDPKAQPTPPAELRHDSTRVIRKTYGPGPGNSEVVLVVVEGGGHTWPGVPAAQWLLGKTTRRIHANDVIWAFFSKHRLP